MGRCPNCRRQVGERETTCDYCGESLPERDGQGNADTPEGGQGTPRPEGQSGAQSGGGDQTRQPDPARQQPPRDESEQPRRGTPRHEPARQPQGRQPQQPQGGQPQQSQGGQPQGRQPRQPPQGRQPQQPQSGQPQGRQPRQPQSGQPRQPQSGQPQQPPQGRQPQQPQGGQPRQQPPRGRGSTDGTSRRSVILGGVGLAALVGGGWFVFGRDDDDDTAPGTGSGPGTTDEVAPQVAFGYDYDSQDNELTITVLSGDAFTAEQVTFRGEGLGAVDGAAWHEVDNVGTDANPESVIGSGDRTRLAGIDSDFQLDIVWISQDGNSSSIISTSSGPDA